MNLLGWSVEKTGDLEVSFLLFTLGFWIFCFSLAISFAKWQLIFDPLYMHSEVYFLDSFIYSSPLCFYFINLFSFLNFFLAVIVINETGFIKSPLLFSRPVLAFWKSIFAKSSNLSVLTKRKRVWYFSDLEHGYANASLGLYWGMVMVIHSF